MNPALFDLGAALFMVAVAVCLVVWFSRYRAAGAQRRRMQMLTRAGVAPELARHSDIETIIKDVQGRCYRCRSEDLCDRWLAGKVEGDNRFCPNAEIFRSLAKTTGESHPKLLSPEH